MTKILKSYLQPEPVLRAFKELAQSLAHWIVKLVVLDSIPARTRFGPPTAPLKATDL